MPSQQRSGNYDIHFVEGKDETDENGILIINSASRAAAKYPDFLPTWDPSEKYPPLKFYKHIDPGTRANASLSHLFPENSGHRLKRITPKFGTEVRGVQLSALDDQAKDELALFVAQRGVAVFRDQDFASKGPKFAVDFGSYFGKLHIHPTSGAPRGFPELHITYRRADEGEYERVFAANTSAVLWHSDVSFELNPTGFTIFTVLDGPDSGGDTLFADNVEAYKRLSPEFRSRLAGLHVLHTSEDQAANSRTQGGVERRGPVTHIHPLVRTHPATGEKYLYLNKPFSRKIVELKDEESEYLLNFLYRHVEQSHDLQLRALWEPNTVVLWDNRSTSHTAIIDWETSVSRHAVRIAAHAERPVEELSQLNRPDLETAV